MTVITFEFIVPALIFLLALWAVTTQMIIPILRGTRLFPALQRSRLELVDELSLVDQEIEAEHLRQELSRKKTQLEKDKHEPLHPPA